MPSLRPAQTAAMEEFAENVRPFLSDIGDSVEVCLTFGINAKYDFLVEGVYRGVILPPWPFAWSVMDSAGMRDRDRRHIIRQLHETAVKELELPRGIMIFRKPMAAINDYGDYTFFDSIAGVFRDVPIIGGPLRGLLFQGSQAAPEEPAHAQAVADAPGYDLKPDPMTVHDMDELWERLREFWRWTGRPSMRELAEQSGRAFSKSTVTKLIHEQTQPTKVPPLSQKYVAGIVRGCGGDEQEIARWVTAFRLLETGKCPANVQPHCRNL